jgi:glycosyltransferase involved in cell wall biosynthesis
VSAIPSPPEAAPEDLPFASVVVVTRNRARWLAGALEALARQDYPAYEVVVVDHSSGDETAEVVAARGYRRVVCPTSYGIGRCRQAGVEAAQGVVIAMCDDDCRPEPSWLRIHAGRLRADPGLGLLGGQVVNVGFPDAQRFKGRSRLAGPNGVIAFSADPAEAEFFGNANLAYRREAIESVGGYDPFFHAGAEIDLALSFRRAGYEVAYEPRAVVEHHFTGIDYKHGRLFWGGELMRLYRHLKHSPPRRAGEWLRFWRDELALLGGDLRRVARATGSAIKRRRPGRLPGVAIELFNVVTARLAVPWLWWRGRRRLAAALSGSGAR